MLLTTIAGATSRLTIAVPKPRGDALSHLDICAARRSLGWLSIRALAAVVALLAAAACPMAAEANNGITTGPDGKIWFTHEGRFGTGPGYLGRVNGDGSVTRFTAGVTPGFSAGAQPTDVTTGPDGRLWFTSGSSSGSHVGRVGRVNPDGSVTEFPASATALAITTGPDGNIWYSKLGGLGRVNGDGTQTFFNAGATPGFSARSNPWGITTGRDRNIWFIADVGDVRAGGRLGRVNGNGTVTEFSAGTTPGFTPACMPEQITTGPDGNIWFSEYYCGRIGRLNGNGTVTEFTVGAKNSNPTGITTGPDGNIWVALGVGLARLNGDGTVTRFGGPDGVNTPGMQSGSIHGITAGPDGRVWFNYGQASGVGRLNPDGTVTNFGH